jgi:hypothetical protein
MVKKEVNNMNLEDVKERKRVTVERKMNEAPLFVETMTNNRNGERQIQINETYLPKDSEEPKYGRKTVNLNVIDVPAVLNAIAALYQDETGKTIVLELP